VVGTSKNFEKISRLRAVHVQKSRKGRKGKRNVGFTITLTMSSLRILRRGRIRGRYNQGVSFRGWKKIEGQSDSIRIEIKRSYVFDEKGKRPPNNYESALGSQETGVRGDLIRKVCNSDRKGRADAKGGGERSLW